MFLKSPLCLSAKRLVQTPEKGASYGATPEEGLVCNREVLQKEWTHPFRCDLDLTNQFYKFCNFLMNYAGIKSIAVKAA